MTILVRAGIPLPSGALVEHAKARGLPVLMSANAFARRYPKGHPREGTFRGFRTELQHLAGLNVALDSAGFVSTVLFGGTYPWSVDQYLDLVEAFPWSFWSSMDLCMEPQVAEDDAIRRLRLAATAQNHAVCAAAAARRGLPAPMPVIQGWTISDYLLSVDWMPVVEWPSLVGVGSMCRRHVTGPNGVLEVVTALDEVLPPHVTLHLFGVKSTALPLLNALPCQQARPGKPPRVYATDSCAWDAAARAECRTGRTMEVRIGFLERWLERQAELQANKPAASPDVPRTPFALLEQTVRHIAAQRFADNILDGALTYAEARVELARSSCWAEAFAKQHHLDAYDDREAIEAFMDDACL